MSSYHLNNSFFPFFFNVNTSFPFHYQTLSYERKKFYQSPDTATKNRNRDNRPCSPLNLKTYKY